MSGYFPDRYGAVRYPIDGEGEEGLRIAQIGAIHAVAAHFTVRAEEPAMVVMPTGSGKTAVLMMSAFVERARRVLVVTPSVLVRGQIKANFETLSVLKRVGVLEGSTPGPRVAGVRSRVTSPEAWEEMREYDVVVGTPNSISPALEDVSDPPEDLFDLILLDEAHHSPAVTWNKLLSSFPGAKRVLFTATPFRQDRREIEGRLVYSYPMKKAYADGIFGQIEYVPVTPAAGVSDDVAIAEEAERVFRSDRENGFDHFLMVRTDSKKRADELSEVYAEHTDLRLLVIHSGHSYSRIEGSIEDLKAGDLDGVICVNMLGEGFDFPNLKIAAVHAPHKSLAVTLQFVGRFARTGDESIGGAKFLAVPSEVEVEAQKLYDEGATWQEIVPNLSEGRVQHEQEVRETLDSFDVLVRSVPETEDLSLYALEPYTHVKIFRVTEEVDLTEEVEFPPGFEVVFQKASPELSAATFVTRRLHKPRWTALDRFHGAEFDLFVVFYDRESKLLFINASERRDSLYEELAKRFSGGTHKILSLARINQVLIGFENARFFNVGMKNRMMNNNLASYRIVTGPRAQEVLNRTDGLLYHRGHVYGKAGYGDEGVTIGYSSASKVWSHRYSQIPDLLRWCRSLAGKIESNRKVTTRSGLDFLTVGREVSEIPDGLLGIEWDASAYSGPIRVAYNDEDGEPATCELLDLDLQIDRDNSGEEKIRILVTGEGLSWSADFSLGSDVFFEPAFEEQPEVTLTRGREEITLIGYLNSRPLNFHFSDSAQLLLLRGNELFTYDATGFERFDPERIFPVAWAEEGVEITAEFPRDERDLNGMLTIHEFLKDHLDEPETSVLLYDHRTGEIADFIAFVETPSEVTVRFYHCKGSGGPKPGDRVDDVYEVCGQVLKSIVWFKSPDDLLEKLRDRLRGGSSFVKGNYPTLKEILERARRKNVRYEVVLVQPGITKAGLSEKQANVLAAASDFLKNVRGEKLSVMASA